MNAYYDASVIEDISEKADALIVEQEMSPLLSQYSQKLLEDYLILEDYLKGKNALNSRKSPGVERKEAIRHYFKSIFPSKLSCLVVNIDALNAILKAVEHASLSDKSNTIIFM